MKQPTDEAIREAIIHQVARAVRDSGGNDQSYGLPFGRLNLLAFDALRAGLYENVGG